MIKTIQCCRICGNPHLVPVIDLGKQHIQGTFEKEGVASPPRRKVPNEIVRCDTTKSESACGAIQARHTIDPEILYRNYWYQSGISQTMKDHLKGIVDTCSSYRSRAKLPQAKSVLDIACNDGTLLRNWGDEVEKWGVDPSDIAGKQNDLNIINECFPTNKMPTEQVETVTAITPQGERKEILKIRKKFDVITTIACFYDVDEPVQFAREVKKHLSNDGVWCFEVAYWPAMLEKLAYDQILAEHIVHYHFGALERVCKKAGLRIFFAQETPTNGGSIICYATHSNSVLFDSEKDKQALKEIRFKEFDLELDEDKTYKNFREEVVRHGKTLDRVVREINELGKSIHLLGASTKMNVIIEHSGLQNYIKFAAERSPEKHGAKTLNGIQIISEEESREMNPDYYLVGPYSFKNEIIEREKEYLEKGGKLIFPLPKIVIVSKDGEIEYKNGIYKEDGKFVEYNIEL